MRKPNQRCSDNKFCMLITGLLILAMACSGCEPLRKKFVRKKKVEEKKEFIPVLDPIEYPPLVESPERLYKYHYSMWQVYIKDLVTLLEEDGTNTKKAIFLVNQLRIQLEEMRKLVSTDKQEGLGEYLEDLNKIEQKFKLPTAMRNDQTVRINVLTLDKQFRNDFRFRNIEENITQ